MAYAENTSVSVEKSKAEIEKLLLRYGAGQFMNGWDSNRAIIAFSLQERQVRFILPLPNKDDPKFKFTEARKHKRRPEQAYAAWEQACRQAWRALALCIKAKLEACESGITTFEDEFMAHIVLPNKETVGQWMKPQIEESYRTANMPPLLMLVDGGG